MTPRRCARFLEHARPWWDVHRHRMAPEVAARIVAMIASGQIEIVAGKIVDVVPNGEGAEVTLRRRGSQSVETLSVAGIISCKGVTGSPGRSTNPQVASLFANGLARADPLCIGIEVAPDCSVVTQEGRLSRSLFAIGPISQAAFWEITAVPDIRLQTAALAARILSAFPERRVSQRPNDSALPLECTSAGGLNADRRVRFLCYPAFADAFSGLLDFGVEMIASPRSYDSHHAPSSSPACGRRIPVRLAAPRRATAHRPGVARFAAKGR